MNFLKRLFFGNRWFLNENPQKSTRYIKGISLNSNKRIEYVDNYGISPYNIEKFRFTISKRDNRYINHYCTNYNPIYKIIVDVNDFIWEEQIFYKNENSNDIKTIKIDRISFKIIRNKIRYPLFILNTGDIAVLREISFREDGELKVAVVRISDDKIIDNKKWKF